MRTRISAPLPHHRDRGGEVEQDVVVIAGIDGDPLLGAGLDDAAHHVERAVAVERRGLDRDRVVDPGEAPPEPGRQHPPADRRLEVEPDQRDLAGDQAAVLDQRVLRIAAHRAQAQQPRVVAEPGRDPRLGDRLAAAPGEPGDHRDRAVGPARGGLGGERQHRLVEPGLADGELGRMDADGEPAGAGVEVVAGERPLAPGIQPAPGVERQRMRRDHGAAADQRPHRRRNVVSREPHRRPIKPQREARVKRGGEALPSEPESD